jgi:Protein of unknown function, DUF599
MFLSLEHHAGRGPPRTQAARLKPASHAGNIPGNSDPKPMTILTLPDLAAFVWFVGAWIVYSIVIERSAKGRTALNALMNRYRDEWMERLLDRDMRMVDAQVTAALQNGAAFFASTSLIAIGGALTLLRSSEEIMTVMSLLPFGATPSRSLWDLKMMGLIVIFVYAFFKFAPGRTGCSTISPSWSALLHRPIRRTPRLQGFRAPRGAVVRRRGPPLQSRPARILFCAWLSGLVCRPGAFRVVHRRHHDRAVAEAVRLRGTQGVRTRRERHRCRNKASGC